MSKMTFQTPKGVKDILPADQPFWEHVEATARRVASLYGYSRLDLPVFEETALFQRGVGEGTDIVEKEMYTFTDRGGDSITLRPEFTAGTMRAYIQNGMASAPKPVKVWSWGPVFRYERPQAGRYRQHTQFNVEAIGEQDPALDLEVMSVAWHLYQDLGFEDLSFQINSIGCQNCRPQYLKSLVEYYRQYESIICEECRKRLAKNPLRVLDCKVEQCRPVIEKAPPVYQMLCPECACHFSRLKKYLEDLKRPFILNHRLVRGLDYYTKTVFEVWVKGIGAQNAVCGGGRYDRLAEILGGAPTPAVGFASGVERLVLTLKEQGISVPEPAKPSVYLACQGEPARKKMVVWLSELRYRGCAAVMGYGDRSMKAQMREANRLGAGTVVILGEEEFGKKEALLKKMDTGEERCIPWEHLISTLTGDHQESGCR